LERKDYHRETKPSGLSKIVKVKDDIIDAIRTAYMMLRFAERKGDLFADEDDDYDEYTAMPSSAGGY